MKNAIFTCSDSNYGDFLVNHWLESLVKNVNLKDIDIIVLDYGLTKEQLKKIKEKGAKSFRCKRDGFPNSIKFRDMLRYLNEEQYDQILTCDGGDIIFQDDISHLFKENRNVLRAVCEEFCFPFDKFFLAGFFKKEDSRKIKRLLEGKRMINAGLLVAPYGLFKNLCKECDSLIKEKTFGPDTTAVNYVLHKEGFKELDFKYNFIIATATTAFYIEDGIFYLENGEKIPVVHNSGYKAIFRPIKNFGHGEENNKLKRGVYFSSKSVFKAIHSIFE